MNNEWNWHVNSLQTRLSDLQSTIDSIKSCVERRPGLDAATRAIAALIEASTQSENALQEFPSALAQILADPAIGAMLIGPQGEVVLYNAAAEVLLGKEFMQESTISSPVKVQFSSDEGMVLGADELPWNRALRGESLPDVRLHLRRASATDAYINVSATPFSSNDNITGAVIFIIDTTEEVQLETSISTLCNTIHDQIAQVGSTHGQLRDLADRLSNTGIQRLLQDGSPAPSKPEEDPNRKKSEPRRNEGLNPVSARQHNNLRNLGEQSIPPAPAQETESQSTNEEKSIAAPPPVPGTSQLPNSGAAAPASRAQSYLRDNEPVQKPGSISSSSSLLDENKLEESGSWAQVSEQMNRFSETVLEAEPETAERVEAPTNRLPEPTLEAERVIIPPPPRKEPEVAATPVAAPPVEEAAPQAQVVEENVEPATDIDEGVWTSRPAEAQAVTTPEATPAVQETSPDVDNPYVSADEATLEITREEKIIQDQDALTLKEASEVSSETIAEPPVEYQPAAAQESEAAVNETPSGQDPSRWSAEYAARYETMSPATAEPAKDFWVSGAGQDQGNGDTVKSSEGDEVVDSAKSLFGKFAHLTKDSYTEGKAQEEKEPDPALPWPELVDGEDYGEPLWDEYTQSEEETTPWQKDAVDEAAEDRFSPLDASAMTAGAPVEQEPVAEAAPVAEPAPVAEATPVVEPVAEQPAELAESAVEEVVEPSIVPQAADTVSPEATEEEDFAPLPTKSQETVPVVQGSVEEVVQLVDEVAEQELQSEPAEPYLVGDTASEDVDFAGMDEEIPAEYVAAPIEQYAEQAYAEPQSDEFAPVDQQADPQTQYAEAEPDAVDASEQTQEEESQLGYTSPGLTKPVGLRDQAKKMRSQTSYNKLRSLSSAADIGSDYLDEGLGGEQLVNFSSESTLVEEGPKRVLVVDDIPVNQKLLLLHLKRLGYEADVASNGQEALDMIADKQYELILMDCDMPVMSGFEAASRIRSNEAYSHRRIPIIALTSYDREGDKEKCIAAGMDDYITKGASQKELKETIERSLVSARLNSEGGNDADDNETDMAPPDITSMLKMYGREEVEEISRLFLSNMGTYIECMQLAIDEKNADSVVHFANAVKGPCAALGMRLMTRLTSDIMAYAESQDWTQVRVKYMRLKAVFVQTREELKKVCPDDSLLAT